MTARLAGQTCVFPGPLDSDEQLSDVTADGPWSQTVRQAWWVQPGGDCRGCDEHEGAGNSVH